MNMTRDTETLEGTVERVLFRAEDTGFTVVSITTFETGESTKVVGTMQELVEGAEITCTGTWGERQGEAQFEAVSAQLIVPQQPAGIVRFLSSAYFPDIGAKTAQRLVDEFGERTLDVIRYETEKVAGVKGVGKKRAAALKESITEHLAAGRVIAWLLSHGVDTKLATRIYQMYGVEAVDRLESDPYKLAYIFKGVGFRKADVIARSLGIEGCDPVRMASGIMFVYASAVGQGHTAVPIVSMAKQACGVLSAPLDEVYASIKRLLDEGELVEVVSAGRRALQTPKMAATEDYLARRLAEMATTAPKWRLQNPKYGMRLIRASVKQRKVPLGEEQRDAILMLLQRKLGILGGGPGVGKTTSLQVLLDVMQEMKLRVKLMAPAGKAAAVMAEATGRPAGTIHRILGVGPNGWVHNEHNPLDCDVVIADEASMNDVFLEAALLKALGPNTALIHVGDPDQLPSVQAGAVLRDMMGTEGLPVAYLSKVYRQGPGSAIVTNANRVKEGEMPLLDDGQFGFKFIQTRNAKETSDVIAGYAAGRTPLPDGHQPREIQVVVPGHKGLVGTVSMNQALQSAVNGEPPNYVRTLTHVYGVGDRIAVTRNNYDLDIFNGQVGHIVDIDDEETIESRIEGEQKYISKRAITNITLAYALTGHKCQGSTFDTVIIALDRCHSSLLYRRWLYTAMTRAAKWLVVVGDVRALELAVKNVFDVERDTTLGDRLNALMAPIEMEKAA